MIIGSQTVGTTAVQIADPTPTFPAVANVVRTGTISLLARNANSGSVYVGLTSAVTTSTGVLIPTQNSTSTTPPLVIQGAPTTLYLIGSAASQIVDVIQQ